MARIMIFKEVNQPRIIYMGTPEISAYVLSSLIEHGYNVVALISNEDKEVGRKRILEATPTKKVALAHNIKVYQPKSIRKDNDFIKELEPDVIITFAYGKIVPLEVLNAPKYGCINLHGSLLPKYRGAAPMQRAIMAGEKKTGVTLMEMVEAMDAGKMFDKEEFPIEEDDNYTSICEKMEKAAEKLILKDLLPYLNGELKGIEQKEDEVAFADKIKPEEEKLDLNLPISSFINMVRGLSLTPGGYLYLDGEKVKIFSMRKINDNVNHELGEIISDKKHFIIQLNGGEAEITSLQPAGKKMMDGASFLNGSHSLLGKRFA